MLNQLRKRLTLLSAVLGGCVVLLACVLGFLLIRSLYLRQRNDSLRLAAERIETQWRTDGSVTALWLEELLQEGDYHAALWENGIPLRYSMTESAQGEGLLTAANEADFIDNTYYRCAILKADSVRGERVICVWQFRSVDSPGLLRLELLFCLLAVGSLCLVLWLSWIVAGKAVQPVRKAMEEQDRFVADASHELRSPLTVLKSSLGQLRENPELAAHDVPLLEKQVSRMQALVENLLMLTGSAKSRIVPLEPLSADTLLIDFADAMLPMAKAHNVHLRVELPEDALPPVLGHSVLLERLLSILTENALRYAPPETDVVLALRAQPKGCEFSVLDHGPGVPDSEKTRIFERFYRASESRTETNHFGLGLSVAAEIAKAHHTRIQVLDVPGGGAEFRFLLPYGGGADGMAVNR